MSVEEWTRSEEFGDWAPEDAEPTADELEALELEDFREPEGEETDADTADLLRLYMRDIGAVQLIGPEEELRLAEIIQTGRRAEDRLDRAMWGDEPLKREEQEELELQAAQGERAKKKLAEANLRLVIYAVKRYKGQGVSMQDLIQEGNVGLMKAAERYKPDRGCRFATYAMYWICQTASRAVAEQRSAIRVPAHMADNIRKVRAATRTLLQELGREPREEEIAAELDKPVDWVRKMRSYDLSTISLETPVGEDEGAEIGDLIPDERQDEPVRTAEDNDRRRRLLEVLDTLPIQEKQVICLRFGIDCDALRMDEVAEVLGLTRERVRQIEEKALRSLLRPERKKLLKGLLG